MDRPRPRPRAFIATLAAFAFAAPVAWLLSTTVPAQIQRPLGDNALGGRSAPVEIPEIAYLHVRGGPTIHRMRLTAPRIDRLASHMEVRLLVATYGTAPSLDRGELSITGTGCVYRTVRGARFPNNDLLTFVRSSACTPLSGTPTGEVRLLLQFDRPGRAALWTGTPPGAIGDDALVISDRSAGETTGRAILRGFLVDVYPANRLRRSALLAYVWQIAPTARWIWIAIGASAALLWAGVFLLGAPRNDPAVNPRAALSRMAGGFCAAAALTLAYAVLVPPFQAADEPNHFVGFASFIHRPGMDVEAGAWARIGHFERIQFRPDEHFTPADMIAPGIEWNDGTTPDASTRGTAVQWLWRALPGGVGRLPAPKLLLTLRLVNALVFSIAVAIFFGIAGRIGRAPWPELLAIPIFLVPTLPFFAMTVSNYGLLSSANVVLAAAIVLDFRDRDGAAAAGPLIGASWMVAALTSRSALPLAAFIAAWLLGRLVIGHRDRGWRPALVYWLGATGFLIVGLWIANRDYVGTMASMARTALPRPIAALALAIVAHPWLLTAAGVTAAAVEQRLAARLRDAITPAWRAVVSWTAVAAAIAILVMLAASAFVQYPILPAVDTVRPTAAVYVRNALLAALTIFRVAGPDLLTSVSFWGGFGWLETLLPAAVVSALVTASALAFAALLFLLGRAGAVRPLVRLALALPGFALAIAAYAVTVFVTTPADLHGRYLIGLYLCMLTIGWSVIAMLAETAWARRADAIRAACCAVFVAVHVFSLAVILTRYF